ncbi:hypothetical protein AWH62_13685 [Maricaulis sp. W15]|uniref:tetratricopeptide repeat-containing sulfotransferase family protein n=1 Tax=Maricaulis sp. W15 TaxID=1772333 RepID=UPI000948E9A3|nr:sulfotransferase [Maricaulis sp. W15]OLF80772.1 hypothetical protein AWH62_13685 [Maricaulis sp. W15]
MSETVEAFIEAGNVALKAGDHDGAALAWCRALDLDPHLARAHNNLGAVTLMAGQPHLALPCFMNATALRRDQPGFWIGLARTLVELDEPARAAACLDAARQALPDDQALQAAARQYPADDAVRARYSGLADRGGATTAATRLAEIEGLPLGTDAAAALAAARELVWALPDRPGLWVVLSRLAMACGDLQQAEFHARRAIMLAPADVAGWHALTTILQQSPVRRRDAERVLLRSLDLCGPQLRLAEMLCGQLMSDDRADDALAVLDGLPAERGGDPARWHLLAARLLDAAGRPEAGAALFRDALADGEAPHATLIAAAIFHEHDLEPGAWLELRQQAAALGADLDHPDLHHARARALLRTGQLDAAEEAVSLALDGDLSDEARRGASYIAGQIADRRGRHDQAWAHFETANRLLEANWEASGVCDHTMPLARLASLDARLLAEIKSGNPLTRTPARPKGAEAGADLAFLVGFPRSGTTLLDSVLRAHSVVDVLEEKPVLIDALRAVIPGVSGDETNFTEAWLDAVEATDPAVLQAAYREQLASHVDDAAPGQVIIDKLPLNMNWAAVIHRIFPAAAFILARRHPLDVAVSNFAQDYAPNNAMLVMTRLERIAAFHAASFDHFERFVGWRRPRLAHVDYEALIDDPQAAIEPVMSMLGLSWEPQQARFFETAKARGRISTPSAHQVTQPLYTRSRERWRHYEKWLSGPACAPLRARARAWGMAVD